MNIKNKFGLDQYVYIVHETEQKRRLIIAIIIWPNGLQYKVANGAEVIDCFEMELSETKDVLGDII